MAMAGLPVPPAGAMGNGTSSNESPIFGGERQVAREMSILWLTNSSESANNRKKLGFGLLPGNDQCKE